MVVATKYVMGVFFHLNPRARIGLLNNIFVVEHKAQSYLELGLPRKLTWL